MTTLSRILLSSSELVLDLLQDKKGAPGFKENQLVEAKVVQVFPQGRAQLRIEGQLVDVKSHIPLSENEILYLKVTKNGDSQVLKLVEAHKPVHLPPGLADMRALGPEGPYEGLAKIVNAAMRSRPQEQILPEPLVIMSKGERPPLPTPASPETSSPVMAQPVNRMSAVDRQLFNALVTNKVIPFELKLASVVHQDSPEKPHVPKSVLEALTQKLTGLLVGKETSAPVLTQGLENSPAPTHQLGKRIQALFNALAPENKAMMTQAIETRSLSMGDKLQELFKSVSEPMIRDKGLREIRDILIKTFIPKTVRMDSGTPLSTTTPTMTAPVPGPLALVIESPPFVNKNVFAQLVARINDMALKPDSRFDSSTLRDLVKNSGLMWENKVRSFVQSQLSVQGNQSAREGAAILLADDVKALSMKLTQSAEPGSQETVETLKRFVDSLEKMQILNCHSSDETGRFLLPLPFFSGETLRFGQLFIDLDQKGGSEKKEGDRMVRVAFLLEMSQLGHVQADFAIFRKSLGGEFIVGSPTVKASIDEALPEFESALALKGYAVTRMECRVINPETLSQASLTERLVNTGGGAVNILI